MHVDLNSGPLPLTLPSKNRRVRPHNHPGTPKTVIVLILNLGSTLVEVKILLSKVNTFVALHFPMLTKSESTQSFQSSTKTSIFQFLFSLS